MPSLIDMIKDTVTFVLNQTVHNWEDASPSRFQRPSSELCSAALIVTGKYILALNVAISVIYIAL